MLSVYTEGIIVGIEGIKKNQTVWWHVSFYRCRYWQNYNWIQIGKPYSDMSLIPTGLLTDWQTK